MRYTFVTTGCLKTNSSFMRFKELGRCLSLKGFDVYYLCDYTQYNSSLFSQLDFAHIELIPGENTHQRIRIKQAFNRRLKLNEINSDIVHFLNPSPNNIMSLIGIKGFVISDWDELLSSRMCRSLDRLVLRLCEFTAVRNASHVVVASKYLQSYFQERFGIRPLYLPYASYLENYETELTPFSEPTAVYMGNFHHDSDHDILLDAWTILKEQRITPNLYLIGGGSHIENVRSEIQKRELDSVTVTGYLPTKKMWNCLRHAHILLFPIRDNTANRMRCPAKTYAYMQASRPIVTNKVGEVAEALGEQAYYCKPVAEDFADIVSYLFSENQLLDVKYPSSFCTWESRTDKLTKSIYSCEPNKRPNYTNVI